MHPAQVLADQVGPGGQGQRQPAGEPRVDLDEGGSRRRRPRKPCTLAGPVSPTAASSSATDPTSAGSSKVRPLVLIPALVSNRQRGTAPASPPSRSTSTSTVNSRPSSRVCTSGWSTRRQRERGVGRCVDRVHVARAAAEPGLHDPRPGHAVDRAQRGRRGRDPGARAGLGEGPLVDAGAHRGPASAASCAARPRSAARHRRAGPRSPRPPCTPARWRRAGWPAWPRGRRSRGRRRAAPRPDRPASRSPTASGSQSTASTSRRPRRARITATPAAPPAPVTSTRPSVPLFMACPSVGVREGSRSCRPGAGRRRGCRGTQWQPLGDGSA